MGRSWSAVGLVVMRTSPGGGGSGRPRGTSKSMSRGPDVVAGVVGDDGVAEALVDGGVGAPEDGHGLAGGALAAERLLHDAAQVAAPASVGEGADGGDVGGGDGRAVELPGEGVGGEGGDHLAVFEGAEGVLGEEGRGLVRVPGEDGAGDEAEGFGFVGGGGSDLDVGHGAHVWVGWLGEGREDRGGGWGMSGVSERFGRCLVAPGVSRAQPQRGSGRRLALSRAVGRGRHGG